MNGVVLLNYVNEIPVSVYRFFKGGLIMKDIKKTSTLEIKVKGLSKRNDLEGLVRLKWSYADTFFYPKDEEVAKYKKVLEDLELVASCKNIYAVGGNSWQLLSAILDSVEGAEIIYNTIARYAPQEAIVFVDKEAEEFSTETIDGNVFAVFPAYTFKPLKK